MVAFHMIKKLIQFCSDSVILDALVVYKGNPFWSFA